MKSEFRFSGMLFFAMRGMVLGVLLALAIGLSYLHLKYGPLIHRVQAAEKSRQVTLQYQLDWGADCNKPGLARFINQSLCHASVSPQPIVAPSFLDLTVGGSVVQWTQRLPFVASIMSSTAAYSMARELNPFGFDRWTSEYLPRLDLAIVAAALGFALIGALAYSNSRSD